MISDQLQTDAIQQQDDTMTAVMTMENELVEDDIEGLKFLCQGLIPGGKLKSVKDVHELADLLEKKSVLSDNDCFILADLLTYIRRVDVLERIGYEEKDVMQRRLQEPSVVKPFYILLYQIAEELGEDDVRKAKYMYGKVPKSQPVKSGLELFTLMVQHKAVWPENVSRLKDIFSAIERIDLVELVDRYESSSGQSVIEELEERFRQSLNLRGGSTQRTVTRFPYAQVPQYAPSAATGPSFDDYDIRRNMEHRPQSVEGMSMLNNPPSYPLSTPTASSASLPSTSQTNVAEQSFNRNTVHHRLESLVTTTPVPTDYDENATGIPWKILDILTTKVPAQYWPDFISRLGSHLSDDLWRDVKANVSHKVVVLLRWLSLPETRALGMQGTRLALVHALFGAGSTLMAQEIASLLGISDVLLYSMSSQTSAYDTNEVSSAVQAAVPARESVVQFAVNVESRARLRAEVQMSGDRIGGAGAQRTNAVPYYSMNKNPRGICLIINNKKFYVDPNRPEAKQMIEREGTDIDKKKLEDTFRALNFTILTDDDLTDIQMVQRLNRVATQDHSRFDCFVCCILTHGVQGALYGCNGVTVPIKDLTGPFRAQGCPSLAGKPKLFFMQACQGREKQPGYPNDMQQDSDMEVDAPGEMIPNEADFLLGYATTPGYVSYRSKTRGSWYITKLTEMLSKYSQDHDILDILTLVNFEVGKGDALVDGGHFKQAPAPMYTLRKKLMFMPV